MPAFTRDLLEEHSMIGFVINNEYEPRRYLMKQLVIGILAVIVLAACTGGSSVLIEGQWKLDSYGSPSDQTPAAPGVETSIEFKDGQISGSVGCNSFGGEYNVEDNTITFGPVMATEMFCEAVAEQEEATFAVLHGKATFTLDGNTLTITSEDGNTVLVLEQV
jgi:heat shock protein HslJ